MLTRKIKGVLFASLETLKRLKTFFNNIKQSSVWGDNIKMTVTLIAPIAMDEGLRFAIREGGRTVGAGVVATIVA